MKKYMYVLLISLWTLGSAITYGQQLEPPQKLGYFTTMQVGKNCKVELRSGQARIAIQKGDSNIRYHVNAAKLVIESLSNDNVSNVMVWLPKGTLIKLKTVDNAVVFSSHQLEMNLLNILAKDKSVVRLNIQSVSLKVKALQHASVALQGTTDYIEASAAQSAMLNTNNLEYDASYIRFGHYTTPSQAGDTVYMSKGGRDIYVMSDDDGNTKIRYGRISVETDDDEDARINIGSHRWVIQRDGSVRHTRHRHKGFEGHWAGIGLGINGYLNKDWGFELDKKDAYMDLLWHKSINIDLNVFEYNMKLNSRKNFGFVTGIGLSINNYRFNKSFTVASDSAFFQAYTNRGVKVKKSKMVLNYIQVPLLLEWNDNNSSPLTRHRCHAYAGLTLGLRIHAHQKTVFTQTGKDFELVDTATGQVVASAISPGDNKSKVHDNFDLQPFKAEATIGVGWGIINLYARMSLNKMFQSKESPELHPFTVGIMLTRW